MLLIRDVNSQEIAFPSRESQFPGLDQDSRFRPVPFTGVIGVGLSAGARRAGAIAGRTPVLFPADDGTPSIDRHSRQWRARNVAKRLGEGLQGERDRGSTMADWPSHGGPGNRGPPV